MESFVKEGVDTICRSEQEGIVGSESERCVGEE